MRAIGLDVGDKTIGVAVSDEAGITAQPVATIKRLSLAKDMEALLKYIEEYSATIIIVGLPVNMDGTIGPRAQSVLKFIDKLKVKTGVPVKTWDERFSTAAINRVLIGGDMSRARRKEVVDKLAAAYILQGYLESLRFHQD